MNPPGNSSNAQYRLAIFASGGGSNADKICEYFSTHHRTQVRLIVSNKPDAGVLNIADKHGIEKTVILKNNWNDPKYVLDILNDKEITHIVLAGFLLLVPQWLVNAFRGRIVNIHPALLPAYGGKGMYGMRVHRSVKERGEQFSGITIHEVDEFYDEGDIIFQAQTEIHPGDSPEDIARKVLSLEHYYFPRVIEKWVSGEAFRMEG